MPPIGLLVKPSSSACNLNCEYCFYKDVAAHRARGNYGFMTPETQEEMLKKAFRFAQGSVSFTFQGGEPTLAGLEYYWRHVRLCRGLNERGVSVSNMIQTNGASLNGEWACFFAENNFLVGLSLDGPKDIHDRFRKDCAGNGTFDAVNRAAALLEKHGVQFNILSVVTAPMAQNANRVLDFYAQKGFRYLQFIPCLDPLGKSGGEEYSLTPALYARFLIAAFKKYYDAFKKMRRFSVRVFDNYVRILAGEEPESCDMKGRCTAGFTIEADGGVYPCDFYVLDDYKMGNVHVDDFAAAARSEAARRFVLPSVQAAEKCRACRWYGLCRGGCRRLRGDGCGEPSVNRFCEAYSSFFEKCYGGLKEIADRYARFGGR